MKKMYERIILMCNTISGPTTMGGNTKILLELARRWTRTSQRVDIITDGNGMQTCENYGIEGVRYLVNPRSARFAKYGTIIYYLVQIMETVGLIINMPKDQLEGQIVYSSSNYPPDTVPALLLKLRLRNCKWIGSYYLVVPSPLKGYYEDTGKKSFDPFRARLFFLYLIDRISIPLIVRYADAIFITNDVDRIHFEKRGFSKERILAIYGGVDLKGISRIADQDTKYDGVFVGRIHPMKGVTQLVDIWGNVCKTKPDARLAIIGNGKRDYERKIEDKIKEMGLMENIGLLGFVDGDEKYKVLKSSRVFLHTSVYDNCGMAAAEGMACGLPVVRFDIKALETPYPKGNLVAPMLDCNSFARKVIELLDDDALYDRIRRDALEVAEQWDWDRRVEKSLLFINEVWDS
jgi:glycosyltransferase involved in cell wall biosynthesis